MTILAPRMRCLFTYPSFHRRISSKLSSWSLLDAKSIASKSSIQTIEVNEKKYVYGHRWQIQEHLVLIDAIEKQAKELAQVGKDSLQKTSKERWENIAAYCQQNGISRTGPQCRDKWHRLTLAFSKIKNWESFRPPGKKSFWKMKVEERHAEGLGFRLDEHTFAALDAMGSSAVAPALVLDGKSEEIIRREAKPTGGQSNASGKPAQHDVEKKECARTIGMTLDVHIQQPAQEDCVISKSSVPGTSNSTQFAPSKGEGATNDVHIGLVCDDGLININNSNVHQTSNKIGTSNSQTYVEEEGTASDGHRGKQVHEDIAINKITPSKLHRSSNNINTCNPQFLIEENCGDLHNAEVHIDGYAQSTHDRRDTMLQHDYAEDEVGNKASDKGIDREDASLNDTAQHINDALHDDRPPLIVSLISKCLHELKGIK